eukprot:13024392-Alexandrium_andersonii.AAC.1
MSASLVGSEMCIRDRCPTQPRPLSTLSGGPHKQHDAHGNLAGRVELGPVSYTHLTLPTICSV